MTSWIVGLCMLLLANSAALSAEITRVDSRDGKTRLDLVGEIQPGDGDKLKAHIASANEARRIVATIRLNSPGGNLLEGVNLSEIVKNGRIATSVLGDATCASACFIVFAAGNERFANFNAKIGVHGVADERGQEVGAATVTMSRILRTLGVPAGILGKLVVTPPSDMVWLTVDDLRSMNVTLFGKPQQIPTGPQLSGSDSQLPPPKQISPADSASTVPTWGELVKDATKTSSEQNNGTPRYYRSCQPELKVCTLAIVYLNKDKNDVMVRMTENTAGKIIERHLCSFNSFGDVRTCLEW
jgi:hypothetical protein